MTQKVANSKIELPRLGERIREARLEVGLSTNKLAVALGVDPRTVHRWQSDEVTPSVVRLIEIAEIVGKPVSFFLLDEEAA